MLLNNSNWNTNKPMRDIIQSSRLQCHLLCFDSPCYTDDLPGGIYVSIFPYVHHGSPAGSDNSPRPGARNRGRGIDSPLPVWSYEVLVVTVLFITVQDHWGTFRGIAILERNMWKKVAIQSMWDRGNLDMKIKNQSTVCEKKGRSLPCGCLQRCWWHPLPWSQMGPGGSQPWPWTQWEILLNMHPHVEGCCTVQPTGTHQGESVRE